MAVRVDNIDIFHYYYYQLRVMNHSEALLIFNNEIHVKLSLRVLLESRSK